jgi:hypothetical protein
VPARARVLAPVLSLALVAAVPVVAAAPAAADGGRVAIGDSVMEGAASQLRARGFKVNTDISRQFYVGDDIVRSYGSSLPRNVVVHLGTNGTVQVSDCKRIVRIAGTSRRVFLVTNKVPRSWQNGNNAALRSCDAAFPGDRVVLVDWYSASRNRPGYFWSDGHHLRPEGALAFARLIDAAVDSRGL